MPDGARELTEKRLLGRRGLELGTIVLLLGVLGAGTTLLRRSGFVHDEWYEQFPLLYIILAVAAVAQVLSTRDIVKLVAPAVGLVAAAILAVPFRAIESFRLLLLLMASVLGFSSRTIAGTILAPVAFMLSLLLFSDAALAWPQFPDTVTDVDVFLTSAIGVVIVVVMVYLQVKCRQETALRQEIPSLRETIDELSAANLGYSSFTELARQQSALEERNRITREIHDGVGYTLTNIIMLSEVSLDTCPADQPTLYENIDAIRMQAKTGLYDTRRALRELRSTEIGIPRGVQAIRNLVQTYSRATGIAAKLEMLVPNDVFDSSDLFLSAYRFVQEALTNTFRHGHATSVLVRAQRDLDWVIVSVTDDGIGASAVNEGIGLQGMRERIESLGGELRYSGVNGFTVIARIPVQRVSP